MLSIYLLKAGNTKHMPTFNKQLLDEVSVISRIIEVEVRVISRSLRLITPTETLIMLDITIIILLYIERKKLEVMFLLLH